MYIFGGKNEEQEFNDLKVMKLINPSERQPGNSLFQHVYSLFFHIINCIQPVLFPLGMKCNLVSPLCLVMKDILSEFGLQGVSHG